MQSFHSKITSLGFSSSRRKTRTLQLNITKKCNQACRHCHVESSPKRTEQISREGLERLLFLLDQSPSIQTVDITGGAPELHPDFRFFVAELRRRDLRVIDRCNLTILFEEGQSDLADFLACHQVEVVASLPCYSSANVEKQRGRGVFGKSIEALQILNSKTYGRSGSPLKLNLVFNPLGPSLPPDQKVLEDDYRVRLKNDFGIEFHELYTITNLPIKRFLWDLERSGKLQDYMDLLIQNFNPDAFESVMCKELVSVSHDGSLYDCDFNQALELKSTDKNIWDIETFEVFDKKEILFDKHCYACTAGSGSSCSGALVNS